MKRKLERILLVGPARGSDIARPPKTDPAYVLFENMPKALMLPLDLATISALTPSDIQVDIWDEAVRGQISDETDFGKQYDLVATTGYMAQSQRMLEIARVAHRRGIPTVVGGPSVSGSPEQCRGIFDVIFIGEAEQTWPQFIQEWVAGCHRPEYRQVQRPDITQSPAPCWDGIEDMPRNYIMGAVQTTRGCPFDCEFCDVIHLFGRNPRHKHIDTVLQEVKTMSDLGMRKVFFCDDNFIGEPKYAKDLLRELIPLNNSLEHPIDFRTQLTINVVKDDELLELLADANFGQVQSGIESPREASLMEAQKVQNVKNELRASIRKIHSYGIPVKASMIVGFDNDDADIFDEVFEFLQDLCIPIPVFGLLKAFPGTPLLARLQRDGRVIDVEVDEHYEANTRAMTNIIPKQMTRVELMEGAKRLHEKLRDWDNFGKRVKGLINSIKRPPNRPFKPMTPDPERAAKFREAMSGLPENARNVIVDLLTTVQIQAPFMMDKVVSMIVHQYGHSKALPSLLESIQRRIDFEKSPEFEPKVIENTPPIPAGFTPKYREVFPSTYRTVLDGLDDKRLVADALIRIWRDFLIRWNTTFTKFEDYHHEHLRELCNRYIEQGNAGEFENTLVNADVVGLSDVLIRRLSTEVIVSVEQDLRGLDRLAAATAREASSSAPVPLTVSGATAS